MGLDIKVYLGLTKVEGKRAKEILENEDGPGEGAYMAGCAFPEPNEAFPGREEGVEAIPYDFKEKWGFRAGSYGGYGEWRRHLANIVGIGDLNIWWNENDSGDSCGPMEELLHFSDCEGTLGPVVSAKLAEDFVVWEERAKEYALELNVQCLIVWSRFKSEEECREQVAKEGFDANNGLMTGSHFWESYQNWKKAFADAAENGFVAFH